MQKNNVLILTIDSETFGELKADFNQVLRTTLANMEAKESNQAKLTVTLQIQLARGIAPDFDKKNTTRNANLSDRYLHTRFHRRYRPNTRKTAS